MGDMDAWSAGGENIRYMNSEQHRRPEASDDLRRYHIAMDTAARIVDAVSKVLQSGFKWGSLFGCFYFAMDALKAYAGHVTLADVQFSVLFSEHAATTFALLFGAGGVLYGRRERKLRKETIERLHPFQRRYEESIDQGRTSSLLTRRGDTRKEDE